VNVTAWSNGLEVTGGGSGVVSHAGLGLVRRLADKTGLTVGLSRTLWSGRVLGHDREQVLADISCVIADGARAISDFRVLPPHLRRDSPPPLAAMARHSPARTTHVVSDAAYEASESCSSVTVVQISRW